ncbi:cell wall hydrolase [Micractinium conductrix]|uniref:Cell wall hydrolase n=1 Tax=Micractinium conductrix TaxID=554055 RepID=A0A2P6VPM1_9CHLO|nr:cell wall hydrolase [Micractinium conductrix]|eukprot:PSC76019.1 cell wall hydrolase [Micractinium conductrix]
MTAKVFAAALLLLAVGANAATVCPTYTVAPGDSISSIASQFKVQISGLEDALKICINGYTSGVVLQPNQKICLPPFYEACRFVCTAGRPCPDLEATWWTFEKCKYYTVQAGDTLDSISGALGLTALELKEANPGVTMLQVNDYVKLPGWYDGCPAPGDAQPCRYYVAQQADSLSNIAIAFSVDLTELQKVNPSLAGDTAGLLQPGQKVQVPPFDESCGEGVKVEKPNTGRCNAVVIREGDTLYSVAAAFQTTTQQVIEINPTLAAGGILTPGSEVFIPPYAAEDCAAGIRYITPGQVLYQPDPNASIQEAPDAQVVGAPTAAPTPAPGPAWMRRRQ